MSKFLKFGIAMVLTLMMGTTLLTSNAFAQTTPSGKANGQTPIGVTGHPQNTQGKYAPPPRYRYHHNRCVTKYKWYRWNGRWYKKAYTVCNRY